METVNSLQTALYKASPVNHITIVSVSSVAARHAQKDIVNCLSRFASMLFAISYMSPRSLLCHNVFYPFQIELKQIKILGSKIEFEW